MSFSPFALAKRGAFGRNGVATIGNNYIGVSFPASLAFKSIAFRPSFISSAFRRRVLGPVWMHFVTCYVSLTLSRLRFGLGEFVSDLLVYRVSHLDFFPSTWG